MKKILNWVLAATLICSASVFTSCKKSGNDLSDKIQGKWIAADLNGEACPTSFKSVVTFESATKGCYSISEINTMTWENRTPAEVTFHEDGFTAIEEDGLFTSVLTATVNSITDNEMRLTTEWTLTGGTEVLLHEFYTERWVRVTDDFEQSVIGTWEAQVQNENKQQTWRWEFKADGTYVFSLKDGDSWQVFEDEMSEYFVDGSLLCTRWQNTASSDENRDWWEIESIQDGKMKWTALRLDEDLTTHTETLELSKVQ
ncbi:MAG: hypothetical protein IJQ93_00020 [Bacteroidales bacterium]|nr:hypothetical protein [Bacteroidales bacterium]MBR0298686.1 hypothetical protein [Bacteroidales bacterium]